MAHSFFTQIDEPKVVDAIRASELRTRGEIRVHITEAEYPTGADVTAEARATFERLGMTATAERNGVLIFVAVTARRFAVLGDSGIHNLVGDAEWTTIASAIGERFRAGQFTEGLVGAITRTGELLATHFPRMTGRSDQDELPNEISRS